MPQELTESEKEVLQIIVEQRIASIANITKRAEEQFVNPRETARAILSLEQKGLITRAGPQGSPFRVQSNWSPTASGFALVAAGDIVI